MREHTSFQLIPAWRMSQLGKRKCFSIGKMSAMFANLTALEKVDEVIHFK